MTKFRDYFHPRLFNNYPHFEYLISNYPPLYSGYLYFCSMSRLKAKYTSHRLSPTYASMCKYLLRVSCLRWSIGCIKYL